MLIAMLSTSDVISMCGDANYCEITSLLDNINYRDFPLSRCVHYYCCAALEMIYFYYVESWLTA